MFGSMSVIVNDALPDEVPRLKIREDMPWCSPDVRAEINGWLLERFGSKTYFLLMSGTTVIASARNVAMLRNAVSEMPLHPRGDDWRALTRYQP